MEFIDEIFTMDDIFSFEEKASKKYGISIPNVSYWNSSAAFQKHMEKVLILPQASLPWDYYYTYSISTQERQKVINDLGISHDQSSSVMGLLLQSSTIAIVNIINLLVHLKKKRLCILQPAYFSVEPCCSMLSLEYGIEHISFENNKPKIPIDKIISGGYDCVWITSPIFCTGYYFDNEQKRELAFLKSMGITLIFDESLALPGQELIRTLPIDREIFAIYSPHKAISINGLKFAVIVCDKSFEDFLEQWVDVFSGALSSSNRDAVFHYISPNYSSACYPAYKSYIENVKKTIDSIVAQFPFASMLSGTSGHYVNVFTDMKIQGKDGVLELLENTIKSTMASFIPSTLNGYALSQGFGFRINLTQDPKELESAVGRILQYLSTRR